MVVLALLSLAALLPFPDSAGAEPEQDPFVGGTAFGGHRYLLFDDVEDLSWQKGKRHCESLGGHLAVVTTPEEAAFVAELCDGRYMYLGATDEADEGTWVWIDGSPWEFTHWLDGQPNDYSGHENYLATYDDGLWVDVDASGSGFWMPTGFICESAGGGPAPSGD
jgi:hypothetical protein